MAANKLFLEKLRARNFRSIGNMFMEIEYGKSLSTLIASENNGSGKSNLAVWALYFVLFGKPYGKDCKIGGLVNSKSNKDCVVELEFSTKGHKWMVRRGYKPAIFEIFKDGQLVPADAAKGDYQAFLQSVIGMDEKAFCNIVALGVERFVPFVQMKAEERRSFVEQMLDMTIISDMNVKAKANLKVIAKAIEQLEYDIGLQEAKYQGHVRTRKILEDKKQLRLSETGAELDSFRTTESTLVKQINLVVERISINEEKLIPTALIKLVKIDDMIKKFNYKIADLKKSVSDIEILDDCPHCRQMVTEQHKSVIRGAAEEEARKLAEPMEKLQDERLKAAEQHSLHEAAAAEGLRLTGLKMQLETKLTMTRNSIRGIEAKMVDSNEDDQIIAEEDAMNRISVELTSKRAELDAKLTDQREHNQLIQVLKDDGVKASIVAQYIPALNQAINQTLDQLNLYVQINIDSEFNVSMFAPNRKGQTLGNLSTGQLRRIDLAVLLAWRDIAKKKASVDCNVLILDEILENLSATGVEEFMDMWALIGSETNLLVISQRAAEFETYFDRTIKYALKDELTVEVES